MFTPRKIQELLPVEFTASELAALADRADELVSEMGRLEQLKAGLPKKIESIKDQIYEVSAKRKAGFCDKLVDCEVRLDPNSPEVVTIRLDTGQEIARRAMTAEERQEDLFPETEQIETTTQTADDNQANVQAFFSKQAAAANSKTTETIPAEEDLDGGTPLRTALTQEEINALARHVCGIQIKEGTPIKIQYSDGAPLVVTTCSDFNEAGNWQKLKAWHVLPLMNVTEAYAKDYDGNGYQDVKINAGTKRKPDWWVMVGPEVTFTVAETSAPNGEGFDYETCLAFCKANGFKNPMSHAQKMKLTSSHNAEIQNWLDEKEYEESDWEEDDVDSSAGA